jgi:hypothetical protein
MALAKGEQNYSEKEKAAMVPLIDVLLHIGASWPQVRSELFRVSCQQDSPFKRVPSESALERMLLAHVDCANMTEYKEKQKDTLKVSLKGKAVTMALAGNVPMLIFCLKNLCGWADTVQSVPDPENAKNQIRLAYDPKSI